VWLVTVVPLLPQIRIGESVGVSEFKRPLAAIRKAGLRLFLVSFADSGGSAAGIAKRRNLARDYRDGRRRSQAKAIVSAAKTPAVGSGTAVVPRPLPLPAEFPNRARQ
jgi:hypothetical protein